MKRLLSLTGAAILAGAGGPASAQTAGEPSNLQLESLRITTGLVNPANAGTGVRWSAEAGLGSLAGSRLQLVGGVDYWSADIDRADLGSQARGSIRDLGLRSDVRWQVDPVKGVIPYAVSGLGVHVVNADIGNDPSLEDALSGLNLGVDLGLGVRSANPGLGWSAEFRRQFVDDIDNWSLAVGANWSFGSLSRTASTPAPFARPMASPGPFTQAVDRSWSDLAELKSANRGVLATPAVPVETVSMAPSAAPSTELSELRRMIEELAARNQQLETRLAVAAPTATPATSPVTTPVSSPVTALPPMRTESPWASASALTVGPEAATIAAANGAKAAQVQPVTTVAVAPEIRLRDQLTEWSQTWAGAVTLRETFDGFRASIASATLFDPTTGQVRPEAERCLGALATVLRGQPTIEVIVDGHSVDPWGDPRTGLDLARAYASSVQRGLVELGVDASRIHARAYVGQVTAVATAFRAPEAAPHRVDIQIGLPISR